MIKITEWTRKAYQKIEYNTLENGDKQYFVIQIDHDNGRYKARWEMITEERRNGYLSTLSIPMAEYNGQTTLKDGRFIIACFHLIEYKPFIYLFKFRYIRSHYYYIEKIVGRIAHLFDCIHRKN